MSRLRASAGGRGSTSLSLIHPEAIYDINFASGQWFGALPSDLVVSRASEALTLTAGGTYANFASNTARITGNGLMSEEARTNTIRNPRASGAAAGVVPTNWSMTPSPDGLTRTVIGAATVLGLPGVRAQWAGTSGATTAVNIVQFESSTQIVAANGQTWTGSCTIALQDGSMANVASLIFRITGVTSGGAAISGQSFDLNITGLVNSSSQTFTVSGTFSDPNVAFVTLQLRADFTNNSAVDFILDIAAPILRQASFAGSPILNADGVTSSATTQPADVVYLPISGVGTEYTIYAQTAVLASHVSSGALIEAWASSSDRIRPNISQTTQGGSVTSGGSSRSIAAFTAGSGAARKVAMRVQGGNIIVACNGSLGTADTGAAPTVAPSRLYFGSGAGGTAAFLNDELLRGAIIPRALTDAELQTLTT